MAQEMQNQTIAQNQFIGAYVSLLEQKPPEQISVSDVVKAASYARSTFYRYFDNIDVLKNAAMVSCTCVKECRRIERDAESIPLEEATDIIANFYEHRAEAVRILVASPFGNGYIDLQRRTMKPMFAALLSRAFDMMPLQLEIASEYIASAKAGMIRLWAANGQKISLSQINKLSESVVERDLWTFVAAGANLPDQQKRQRLENRPFEYPWL